MRTSVMLSRPNHAIIVFALAQFESTPGEYSPIVRLALANIGRPGAPTTSALLSLGLGLTVLVMVALVQANLER